MKNRGVQYGPRFGFAYALTGDDNLGISANYAWSKSLGYYPPFCYVPLQQTPIWRPAV
jgi:hypothetical protein